jgi:hypothetical protein
LLWELGCSAPAGVLSDENTAPADQHRAPFHQDGTKGSPSDPGEAAARNGSAGGNNPLPFHDTENLPAGTLLIVRLKNVVLGGNSASHSVFEATVDTAVVVDGNTLIPQGAPVTGRVESAHISKVQPNRTYLRLVLSSVHVGGLDIPVQTASLFARQSPTDDQSASVIRLEAGRRLTFRFTEPVYVANQRAKADH